MIRLVIFDMDGTVLDTLTTIAHYVNISFQKFGIPPVTPEECRDFVGNGAKLIIRRALASKGISDDATFEKVYADYIVAYDADPAYLTAPYPGILPMMEDLRAAGIRIGIVSNKPHSAAVPLAEAFFGERVDLTCGGRDGVPLKPDPAAPLGMAEALGALPEETVYVGDSAVDMKTGKNMKAALTVGVTWGFRPEEELKEGGCDTLAHDTEELTKIILSLNRGDHLS